MRRFCVWEAGCFQEAVSHTLQELSELHSCEMKGLQGIIFLSCKGRSADADELWPLWRSRCEMDRSKREPFNPETLDFSDKKIRVIGCRAAMMCFFMAAHFQEMVVF